MSSRYGILWLRSTIPLIDASFWIGLGGICLYTWLALDCVCAKVVAAKFIVCFIIRCDCGDAFTILVHINLCKGRAGRSCENNLLLRTAISCGGSVSSSASSIRFSLYCCADNQGRTNQKSSNNLLQSKIMYLVYS